jgi:hypothetical protein
MEHWQRQARRLEASLKSKLAALTETQRGLVHDAINQVPPAWQQRYLDHIADRLGSGAVTDQQVIDAVHHAKVHAANGL